MHMNSAPHLQSEDRADFERILDDVLRNAHERPDLADIGRRLTAEQLRTMALNATDLIATAAAAEYEHYTAIREEARSPAASGSVRVDRERAPEPTGTVAEAEGPGAGLAAVITVLVPVLGGIAAVIFLLVGYLLKALRPAPAFAGSLLAVGWFFAAVTALGILAAATGLLITALRNGPTHVPAEGTANGELPEEVGRAREAWRHAVLERGILPFLRTSLAAPGPGPATPRPPRSVKNLPTIGYSRPDFSSPGEGSTAGRRPTFSSPDFTSPDFGGPEKQPD
ncbi:membrane protein [Streptomyces hebeiensis]|uniref:Membrane protein n=1 Tax=Streptomyces hebeiensis TaxID=229486 RepID=A0ABN1UHR9_9ACTN